MIPEPSDANPDLPRARTARVDVLLPGSLSSTGGGVASSCTLVRDAGRIIVVDPGMAPGQAAILDPLRALGLEPADVTDVVISHHHPDHTINVGLFGEAAVHDHWATYKGVVWDDAEADRRELAPSVRLLHVPGHTAEDIATVVGTADGVVVLTHLWWSAEGPPEDPLAEDAAAVHVGRERVLAIADRIIPGHGPSFEPGADTPR
ncbi:MAG TPA: MBL fold metallo-hydrolase [Candidatus Limnocylindrales bacterium]